MLVNRQVSGLLMLAAIDTQNLQIRLQLTAKQVLFEKDIPFLLKKTPLTRGKSLAWDLKPAEHNLRRPFKVAAIFVFVWPVSTQAPPTDTADSSVSGLTSNVWSIMAAPRPLKRPRLGQPDVYPQDSKQREVQLNHKLKS